MDLRKFFSDLLFGIYGAVVATLGMAVATIPMMLAYVFTGNIVAAFMTPFYMAYAIIAHGLIGGAVATAANNHFNGDIHDKQKSELVGKAGGFIGTLLTPFRIIREVFSKIYSFQLTNSTARDIYDCNLDDVYNIAFGKPVEELSINEFKRKHPKFTAFHQFTSYVDGLKEEPAKNQEISGSTRSQRGCHFSFFKPETVSDAKIAKVNALSPSFSTPSQGQ